MVDNTLVWPRGSFACLVIAMFCLFVLQPLFIDRFWSGLALQVSSSLIFLFMIYAFSSNYTLFVFSIILGLPYLVFQWASIIIDSPFYMSVGYTFSFLFLSFSVVILSRRIIYCKSVGTVQVLETAIVYLMFGILWSMLYGFTDFIFPHSFNGIDHPDLNQNYLQNISRLHFDMLYFSLSTLTTLGFGDIDPVHNLARSLAVLEAVFGQLFMAIVVARQIALWVSKNP